MIFPHLACVALLCFAAFMGIDAFGDSRNNSCFFFSSSNGRGCGRGLTCWTFVFCFNDWMDGGREKGNIDVKVKVTGRDLNFDMAGFMLIMKLNFVSWIK